MQCSQQLIAYWLDTIECKKSNSLHGVPQLEILSRFIFLFWKICRENNAVTCKSAEHGSIVKKQFQWNLFIMSPLSKHQKHFLTCPFDPPPENQSPAESQ